GAGAEMSGNAVVVLRSSESAAPGLVPIVVWGLEFEVAGPRVHPPGSPFPILNACLMSLDPWLLAPPRYPESRTDLTNPVRTYPRRPVLAWEKERALKRSQETRLTNRKSGTAMGLHPHNMDWTSAVRSGRSFLENGTARASARKTFSLAEGMISDRAQRGEMSLLGALDSDPMPRDLFGEMHFEGKGDYGGRQLTAAQLDYKLGAFEMRAALCAGLPRELTENVRVAVFALLVMPGADARPGGARALPAHRLSAPVQDIARHGVLVFRPHCGEMVQVAAARVDMPNMAMSL
ncbi:unnamed protein product, partial [Prorocentrum cordatum]